MDKFINSLAKGFVRSTVNQVGRDAGKVISNNLYGDRHSTPYRNASSRIVDYGKVREEGTKVIEPSSTVAYIWVFIAFLFNFIGAIILLLVGWWKMKKKYIAHAWVYESQAVYVQDRRRRTGMRYDGDNITRRKVKVVATDDDVEMNEKDAKIYIFGGILIFALYILIIATCAK